MSNQFKIRTTFTLESQDCFVVAGDIIEGEVTKGMLIKTDTGRVTIKSIEIATRKDESLTSLLIAYGSDKERKRLQTQLTKGLTIYILPL